MTKYYAVIDTNVIVSSLLKDGSIPNKVAQENSLIKLGY